MLNIEKWTQGKPKMIAACAVQLVTFSDFLYEILPQAKERRLFNHQFSLPDLPVWFRLYRSPLKPLIAFVNLIGEFDETGAKLKELIYAAQKLFKILNRNPNYLEENPPSEDDVKYWLDSINYIFTHISEDIRNEFDPQPIEPEEKAKFFKFLEVHEQELGFFFFLYVPSLLLFQASPRSIYREAIKGNIVAITKLIKLDPLMLHEPSVSQHIQALRFSNKSNSYDNVIKATFKLAVTDHKQIEDARKKSKVMLASIISALSHLFGQPYDHTQIAELFDAYAKDKDKDEDSNDSDLPVEESLRKAIKRHSPPWHNLFQDLDNKK